MTSSANGGYHHEDRDLPSPSLPTTIDDVAAAVGALAAEVRDQHLVVGERLQALHDRGGEAEKVAKNRHEAVTTSIRAQSEATQALATTVKALGDHVETLAKGLAPKADVEALGAQLGRAQLESVAGDAKIAASVSRVRALAAVRVGALIGAGAALYKLFDLFYPLLHRG